MITNCPSNTSMNPQWIYVYMDFCASSESINCKYSEGSEDPFGIVMKLGDLPYKESRHKTYLFEGCFCNSRFRWRQQGTFRHLVRNHSYFSKSESSTRTSIQNWFKSKADMNGDVEKILLSHVDRLYEIYHQGWIQSLFPNSFSCIHWRVRLANRGRLLLRTPGPVPFGTCICSDVETNLSWTCHIYGLRNIPRYFYFALNYHIIFILHLYIVILKFRLERQHSLLIRSYTDFTLSIAQISSLQSIFCTNLLSVYYVLYIPSIQVIHSEAIMWQCSDTL